MIPPTMLVPHEDLQYHTQMSPELRRMHMFNRARRDEREAMVYSMNARQTGAGASKRRNENKASSFSRLVDAVRNGIGSALVTVGNRIQSPA